MNRWDIINAFIEKHNYKSYLEIGYYKGWSFDQVTGVQIKVAIDPNPVKLDKDVTMSYGGRSIIAWVGELDKGIEECPTEVLYKLTSDDFFEQEPDCIFDIIFIDGLHEAEQVARDIENSLKHLSPGGTIILHDCNPPKYEHTTTGIDGCWTGDTYKAFVKFRFQHPEFVSFVIDTDWGCGVILTPTIGEWLVDIKEEEIEEKVEWSYFDEHRKDLLGLLSVEDFKTIMNERTTDTDSTA